MEGSDLVNPLRRLRKRRNAHRRKRQARRAHRSLERATRNLPPGTHVWIDEVAPRPTDEDFQRLLSKPLPPELWGPPGNEWP